MKTLFPKQKDFTKKWYMIDADGKVLGRMASEVAKLLRGKHKPEFTPFLDCGDEVVIINASKVVMTGKKTETKIYRYHSNFPGGLKEIPYTEMMEKKPELVIYDAVRKMLTHNRLQKTLMRHLRVYKGAEHKQTAQKPEVWEF
ncbi:MAG: 50S ribosomal protein L13 [bacterium]|nr:50S ribosomal protein L13 [bacterium]